MTLTSKTAKQFRDVHLGGNWTAVNLKDTLTDITWQKATTKIHSLNTIATCLHINYYVAPALKVLQGEQLTASDKFSFDTPPINSADDWQALIIKALTEAELLAIQIKHFDEAKLLDVFIVPKYGTYYRDVHGIIAHTH